MIICSLLNLPLSHTKAVCSSSSSESIIILAGLGGYLTRLRKIMPWIVLFEPYIWRRKSPRYPRRVSIAKYGDRQLFKTTVFYSLCHLSTLNLIKVIEVNLTPIDQSHTKIWTFSSIWSYYLTYIACKFRTVKHAGMVNTI